MRKNLPPLILVAALAASPFVACRDTSREMDDLSQAHIAEEPPAGEMAEASAGSAAVFAPEVPGSSAGVVGDGAQIEPAPAGGAGTRGSVVVIPVDELFPSNRDDSAATATGLDVRLTTARTAGPAAQAASDEMPEAPAGPGVLPSTPGLPSPAEPLPVTVIAVVPAPAGVEGTGGTGERGAGASDGTTTVPEPGTGGAAPTELRVTLVSGEDVAIPPGARLEVASPVALVDVRVRLFDENDRILPSRDRVSVGKGTEVRIVPETPLPPGSAFRLEIAGQLQPYPTGVDGEHFAGRTYRFHTTGEKPSPPPPPAKKQRRRR